VVGVAFVVLGLAVFRVTIVVVVVIIISIIAVGVFICIVFGSGRILYISSPIIV